MFYKLVLLIRGDTRWHSRKSRKPHIVGECGKKTALEPVVLYLRRVKRRIDRWSGHPEGGTRHIRSPIRCNGVLHEFGQSFFSRFDLGAVLMRLRGPECGSHRRFPFSLAARGHPRVTGERQQVGALWEDTRAARVPERPCLPDALLSCAGSGEFAPEIGFLEFDFDSWRLMGDPESQSWYGRD
jgi:hypothetical protein